MSDTAIRAAGADDRNRQARGDRRRQQILDAAVDLFAENGYRGTGVAALAGRVGMTATGLLYYFGSKERLLQEVVAERNRAEEVPPELRFVHLRGLGQHNATHATLTRLFIVLASENLDRDASLHDFFVERYDLTRSLVRALLEEERDAGTLRHGVDVEQVAREVVGVILGVELQWLMDPEQVDYAATIETYFDRLAAEILEPSS